MTYDSAVLAGAGLILLAAALALFVAFRPRYTDINVTRRRPPSESNASVISKLSGVTVAAVERRVGQKSSGFFGRDALGG